MAEYRSTGDDPMLRLLPQLSQSVGSGISRMRFRKERALDESIRRMVDMGVDPDNPQLRSALADLRRVSSSAAAGWDGVLNSPSYKDRRESQQIRRKSEALVFGEQEQRAGARENLGSIMRSLEPARSPGAGGFGPTMTSQNIMDTAFQKMPAAEQAQLQFSSQDVLRPTAPFDPRTLSQAQRDLYASGQGELSGLGTELAERRARTENFPAVFQKIDEARRRGWVKNEEQAAAIFEVETGQRPRARQPKRSRDPEERHKADEKEAYKRGWDKFSKAHSTWAKRLAVDPTTPEEAGPEPDFNDFYGPELALKGFSSEEIVSLTGATPEPESPYEGPTGVAEDYATAQTLPESVGGNVEQAVSQMVAKWPDKGEAIEAKALGRVRASIAGGMSLEDAIAQEEALYSEARGGS